MRRRPPLLLHNEWLLALLLLMGFVERQGAFSPSARAWYQLPSTRYDPLDDKPCTIGQSQEKEHFRRNLHRHIHFMSSASKSSGTLTVGQEVIYQKVIRPSKLYPDLLFLGYLVEYLESHFKLPSKLPMTYESSYPSNDEKQSRWILAWDSPLSSSPPSTRMEVEVIGIYSQGNKKNDKGNSDVPNPSAPNMAMVVVRKAKSTSVSTEIPPMMQNLFKDSEKRILRALDHGLEDFMMGKIQLESMRNIDEKAMKDKQSNYQTAQEAIEAELVNDSSQFSPNPSHNRQDNDNLDVKDAVIIDTGKDSGAKTPNEPDIALSKSESLSPPEKGKNLALSTNKLKASQAAAMETMKVKAPQASTVSSDKTQDGETASCHEDFAVEAAKRIVKKRMSTKNNSHRLTDEDFAVAAARKIAFKATSARRQTKPKRITAKSTKRNVRGAELSSPSPSVLMSQTSTVKGFNARNLSDKSKSAQNYSFRTTISRPSDWAKKSQRNKSVRLKKKQNDNQHGKSDEPAVMPANMEAQDVEARQDTATRDRAMTSEISSSGKKRKVNLNVVDAEEDQLTSDPFKARCDDIKSLPRPSTKTELVDRKSEGQAEKVGRSKSYEPTKEQLERDIMKAAVDAMEELAEQGKDMTPEELLQDVLKFDEERKQESAEGSGFVSGAFEKAKELLREQHQRRMSRVEEANTETASPTDDALTVKTRESTLQEELRRMFEAGQNIAENMITKSENTADNSMISSNAAITRSNEDDVDALIAGERTVSSHARVLDDELAELEVRINASPGEYLDGPRKNPIFDILSGPEVYNPNVDPETVNFPGAMPGTKDVSLPSELDEAVNQARFATEVLQNMQQVESQDEAGQEKTQYRFGKQELSQQQVDSLRRVVVEATSIGLIEDPLNILAERSRLQIVLDELWDQPAERFREIASNYKDLLLSDHFTTLVKERLNAMADQDLEAHRRGEDDALTARHSLERELLGQLVVYAQLLLKETRALGAELEAQQLEIVRSICKVAMDPSYTTEEETAMALTDAVRDMRPLLDDVFVAYLKYAVAEEKARLARAGQLDDPEHNRWLCVLLIVQQGVYNEISRGINRYLEHIWYVLRMETAIERRMLLSKLIDVMPTMDVRPFVQVVENIVASLGDGVRGEFEDIFELGEMTNKLLQLHRDVQELLPPERIERMSRDADEWAARQRKKLSKQRKVSQQRLQAARDSEHLQGSIDSLVHRGDFERMD